MSDEPKFGQLRLSIKGTNNGRGFDIFYDFGKVHKFVEFDSKPEFYFIQPWMQFPSQEYTDECMRVSIEMVHRFNNYPELKEQNEDLKKAMDGMRDNQGKILTKREYEAYDAVLKMADGGTPQQAIDYLRKMLKERS